VLPWKIRKGCNIELNFSAPVDAHGSSRLVNHHVYISSSLAQDSILFESDGMYILTPQVLPFPSLPFPSRPFPSLPFPSLPFPLPSFPLPPFPLFPLFPLPAPMTVLKSRQLSGHGRIHGEHTMIKAIQVAFVF
jgi:hypothetical protein